LIELICRQFQAQGSQFLTQILMDVLWGWERYLAQMRNDIRGVAIYAIISLTIDHDKIPSLV
jgi:hypothetical protein